MKCTSMKMKRSAGVNIGVLSGLMALTLLVTACGGSATTTTPSAKLSGTVKIDGSSTVFPISEAMAEEFMRTNKDVKVTVAVSGTSGGFKKWVKGETDINDASRPIKPAEIDEAKTSGVEPVEIKIGYDGLSVVVSTKNTWLTCVTTAELKKIWDKGSTVKRWKEVNTAWPDEEIKLYGPGTDSGTFEYFTEFINGKSGQSRADYTASEDDNVLVKGVEGSPNAMGYFGYAYYVENKSKIRTVAVDAGKGCVEPSPETISQLTYPISRLIYIYPSAKALQRPEVKAFVTFYLQQAPKLVAQVGYTPLKAAQYEESLSKLK